MKKPQDRSEFEQTSDLQGKVCVVLGAGSIATGWGIGKATSMAYARAGARVVACDVNGSAAEETAQILRLEGHDTIAVQVDVTDSQSVHSAMELAADTFGGLDVVHNNVGIGKAGPSSNTTPEDWRRIADANLLSLHISTQAALPHMRKRGGGVFLTTSSIGSVRHIGVPHLAYGVTKAAANHFSRMVAVEYAAEGIRSNVILVGLVDTPRIETTLKTAYGGEVQDMKARRAKQVPLGFMGDAWDVAHASVFLASDKARFISGAELVLDGALISTTRAA